MGYRSDIKIYLNKLAFMQFIEELNNADERLQRDVLSEFEYADLIYVDGQGGVLFGWECYKWYTSRPGVAFITDTVTHISNTADESLGDENNKPEVVYAELGESDDDTIWYESSTSSNPLNIYIRREISCILPEGPSRNPETFIHDFIKKEK